MSIHRSKKSLEVNLTSRADAERTMSIHADTVNLRRALVAEMDDRVLAIKADYEKRIAKMDALIQGTTDDLEAWALTNPDEFPKGRKTIVFLAGCLGFRTGTPKLSLLSRAWNWQKVTEAVCQYLPNFVRSKPEVDKEAILSQRDDEAIQAVLPLIGLKVTQGESFFVEPNLTEAAQSKAA